MQSSRCTGVCPSVAPQNSSIKYSAQLSLCSAWDGLGWIWFGLVWLVGGGGGLTTTFLFAFLLVLLILGCILKISFVVCLEVPKKFVRAVGGVGSE